MRMRDMIHIPRWIRFALSGVTTAVVQLVVLYLCADILAVHYLIAASLAFVIAVVTNFILQKQWTYEDVEKEGTVSKFAVFVNISFINLILNALGMYIMVDLFGVWHMFAQCVMMGILAVMNYVLYGAFVFRTRAR